MDHEQGAFGLRSEATSVVSSDGWPRGGLLSAIAAVAAICVPLTARAQLTPDVIAAYKNVVGSRIEAAIIVAGDQGVSGGTMSQASGGTDRRSTSAKVTKFGGAGNIGQPKPLGSLPLRWQPRFQGSIGYLAANNRFNAGPLQGDEIGEASFAMEFGGGLRFWFNDHLSFAPTVMGMYGHIKSEYTPNSDFAKANLLEAQQLGLVDWTTNTWSIIPAADVRYVFDWHRTAFKVDSEFNYFYTRTFRASNPSLSVGGSSGTWRNKLEVDVPLGLELFHHELHTGGFFSRTELYGNVRTGLDDDHMYQAHGRLVLDFLGKLWKMKWIGLGGSYIWGSTFHAWTVAADIAIKL